MSTKYVRKGMFERESAHLMTLPSLYTVPMARG